jgi:hypothetical protein
MAQRLTLEGHRGHAMAVTMLTPTSPPADDPGSATGRWRRATQGLGRKLALPVAVKAILVVLVVAGLVRIGPAFVLDTAISVAAIAYGWRVTRRKTA